MAGRENGCTQNYHGQYGTYFSDTKRQPARDQCQVVGFNPVLCPANILLVSGLHGITGQSNTEFDNIQTAETGSSLPTPPS
jgi:hypothetical protein